MSPNTEQMLSCLEPLRRPIVREIISSLRVPVGSRGLDVGCGMGLQMVWLAQAVGPHGHVTGLDTSAPLLEIAKALLAQACLADRVSFRQGSWERIPCEEDTFDWVWSMDAVGYAPHESTIDTIRELVRVTKPGGRLALGYWSSQCLLPGYPALEARLDASSAGIAPFTMDSRPETHFLNAPGWLREAGVVDVRVETFVQTVSAPLGLDLRGALIELFAMRWGTAEVDVSPEDWREYLRLCRPHSHDLILNRPDYSAFFTYSIFSGIIPEKVTSSSCGES